MADKSVIKYLEQKLEDLKLECKAMDSVKKENADLKSQLAEVTKQCNLLKVKLYAGKKTKGKKDHPPTAKNSPVNDEPQ